MVGKMNMQNQNRITGGTIYDQGSQHNMMSGWDVNPLYIGSGIEKAVDHLT